MVTGQRNPGIDERMWGRKKDKNSDENGAPTNPGRRSFVKKGLAGLAILGLGSGIAKTAEAVTAAKASIGPSGGLPQFILDTDRDIRDAYRTRNSPSDCLSILRNMPIELQRKPEAWYVRAFAQDGIKSEVPKVFGEDVEEFGYQSCFASSMDKYVARHEQNNHGLNPLNIDSSLIFTYIALNGYHIDNPKEVWKTFNSNPIEKRKMLAMNINTLDNQQFEFARWTVSAYIFNANKTGIRDQETYDAMSGLTKKLGLDKNPIFKI